MRSYLIRQTPSGVVYIGEMSQGGVFSAKMDHLACFVPGMLALGVLHGREVVNGKERWSESEITAFVGEGGREALSKELDDHLEVLFCSLLPLSCI